MPDVNGNVSGTVYLLISNWQYLKIGVSAKQKNMCSDNDMIARAEKTINSISWLCYHADSLLLYTVMQER